MDMADKNWGFFQDYGEYSGSGKIQRSSMKRIIEASHKRNDGLIGKVPQEYQSGTTMVQVHKSCMTLNTSADHINRFKRKHETKVNSEDQSRTKKLRQGCGFDFQKHCLFCLGVKSCIVPVIMIPRLH